MTPINTPTQLADCTAHELHALYRSGQATPVEATQAVLARIEARNPALNAFCLVAAQDALASARASQARWQQGQPLSPMDYQPIRAKAVRR